MTTVLGSQLLKDGGSLADRKNKELLERKNKANESAISDNATAITAVQDSVTTVSSALDTHKTSSDHDGRYYTETEVNTLLTPSTTNFDGVLTSSEDTFQKIFDKLDELKDYLWRDNTNNNNADMHIQSGRDSIAYSGTAITFDNAYTVAPHVVISCEDRDYFASAASVSTTGFTGYVISHAGATGTKTCHWIAIGKKS